jgi:dienelactone hydrolase
MKRLFSLLLIMLSVIVARAQLTVTFPSKDGVTVTADWYPVSSQMPVILLCHQENSSRGEFIETALRLNKFGFNCLAVDLRAGGEMNGLKNETAASAAAKKKSVKPEDAEQDMLAAIEYLFGKYNRPVSVLGSGYSASLALRIASGSPKVSSVIVFSPGEYFESKSFTADHIKTLTKPVFATSSRMEADSVTDLMKDINSRIKIQYLPSSSGDHGAKVLWPDMPDNQEYWIALMSFLDKIKSQESGSQ